MDCYPEKQMEVRYDDEQTPQTALCVEHVFHVLSKVPAQRGGPSCVQHVPRGPRQCFLL